MALGNRDIDLSLEGLGREEEVEERLLRGVVSRAGHLSALLAVLMGGYSYSSYNFIKVYLPDLTFIDNLWPRVLVNCIPLAAYYWFSRNRTSNVRLKAWIWTIGFPFVLLGSCMVYVWPLLWAGNTGIFPYVHGANAFIFVITLVAVAPPKRLLLTQIGLFVLLIVMPILFGLRHDPLLSMVVLSDYGSTLLACGSVAYGVYKLRRKIADFDVSLRQTTRPFLGKLLQDVIYREKVTDIQNKEFNSLTTFVDLRGSTELAKRHDEKSVDQFLDDYIQLVVQSFSKFDGYCQKSSGDGYCIYFGLSEIFNDVNDLPAVTSELEEYEHNRRKALFTSCLNATHALSEGFEVLKIKHNIPEWLGLGVAIVYGKVKVKILGDEHHRAELDFRGIDINRCARLEKFTKQIRKRIAPTGSICAISTELRELALEAGFMPFATSSAGVPIDDFPEMDPVYFEVLSEALGVNKTRKVKTGFMAS